MEEPPRKRMRTLQTRSGVDALLSAAKAAERVSSLHMDSAPSLHVHHLSHPSPLDMHYDASVHSSSIPSQLSSVPLQSPSQSPPLYNARSPLCAPAPTMGLRACTEHVVRALRKSRNPMVLRSLVDCVLVDVPNMMPVPPAKTLRRRVYDATNVLEAAGLIARDTEGRLFWTGAPIIDCDNDHTDDNIPPIAQLRARICAKRERANQLSQQLIALKGLITSNIQSEITNTVGQQQTLKMPFLVLSTGLAASISCEVADDQSRTLFDVSQRFTLLDDGACVRRVWEMGDVLRDPLEPFVDPKHRQVIAKYMSDAKLL